MKRFMRKFRKQFRYGEKGFTLIELLIVVAILGILMAVVIPNVATFMRSGQKAAAQAELSTVQTAVFAMMADQGLGAVTSAAVDKDTDMSPAIASFLGSGLTKLEGTWTVGTDGYISDGTYGGWTYDASAVPPLDWVYT